jgi:hypothetical protein
MDGVSRTTELGPALIIKMDESSKPTELPTTVRRFGFRRQRESERDQWRGQTKLNGE